MVGSLLEIWSPEMDLAEDTWSEVSLGSSGMAIVVVENQRTSLFIAVCNQKVQASMMPYSVRVSPNRLVNVQCLSITTFDPDSKL